MKKASGIYAWTMRQGKLVSYFTVNAIVGELDFPSSEIFYFPATAIHIPVDTSMNVEIVENRKAINNRTQQEKGLKDLDNHAYQAGGETSSNVVDALDSVDELETDLDQTKESMYKLRLRYTGLHPILTS